jgi:hypothetical protein
MEALRCASPVLVPFSQFQNHECLLHQDTVRRTPASYARTYVVVRFPSRRRYARNDKRAAGMKAR